MTVGRLRRRRRYRPSDPRPGRDFAAALPESSAVRPTPGHGRATSVAETPHLVGDSASSPGTAPILRATAASCVVGSTHPGVVEIGIKDGDTVSLDLTAVGVLSVSGPVVHEVVRAWCAAFLTSAGPAAVEVLISVQLAATLFPGLGPTMTIRTIGTDEALLGCVEAEIIGRSRRLAEDDLPDAASYRTAHPEDPLPFLVVIVDQVPDALATRWHAVCESAGRLDVAVVMVGDGVPGTSRIITDSDYTVSGASPDLLDMALRGASLFRLGPTEASELIGQVVASRDDGPEGDDSDRSLNPQLPDAAANRMPSGVAAQNRKRATDSPTAHRSPPPRAVPSNRPWRRDHQGPSLGSQGAPGLVPAAARRCHRRGRRRCALA